MALKNSGPAHLQLQADSPLGRGSVWASIYQSEKMQKLQVQLTVNWRCNYSINLFSIRVSEITTGLVHHLENNSSYHPERKKLYLLLLLSDGRARLSAAPLHLVQQQTISSCSSNLWVVEMVDGSLLFPLLKIAEKFLSPISAGLFTATQLECLPQMEYQLLNG